MVEFHKVEVPRLRLPQKQHPLPQYGSKFDVGSGPVGTSRIDPGLYSPAKRKEGKIPGYSGHLPLVSEGHVIGRSFGFLSRLDSTVPLTFRQAMTNSEWPDEMISRCGGAQTARDALFTVAETRVLNEKFRRRDLRGEDTLRDMRLKVTPRAQTARTVTSRSVQEVEKNWMKLHTNNTRVWQPWEEIRKIPDPLHRPNSAAGRAPNREEATWRQCAEFLQALRLPEEVFDASLDSIFPDYGPDSGWSCGELHEIPKGWLGFGLKMPDWAERKRVFDSWNTVFYPCAPELLETILRTGSVVMPGDVLVDGTKSKSVFLSQKNGVEKTDPNTPRKDRCTTRVYTTPSIRYAMLKLAALTRNAGYVPFQGKRISIVLQCKQMGGGVSLGGFQKCGDTIGWRLNEPPRGQPISPVVPNHEIEWYTMRRSSVLPYRVLLKVEELEVRQVQIPGSGEVVTGPAMAYKDVKWKRADQPPFGSMTLPGLTLPYQDFAEPGVDKDVRSGGLEHPYLAFPEAAAVRDKHQDPMLRPSTQPTEPEAMVKPSLGWLEGVLPASLKQIDTRTSCTVSGLLAEMKDKFEACAGSLNVIFNRIAANNEGQLLPEHLTQILMRLNIVRRADDPVLEELWQYLDEDSGGSVSIEEFTARFGLVGNADNLLENFRRKLGGRFKTMRHAFRDTDANHSGTVDKEELRRILDRFNLLLTIDNPTYDELWDALDRDKSGSIDYEEFVDKFAGQAGNVVTQYGNEGKKVEARKTHTAAGTRAHTVSALSDEGTACYAQMDFASAEHKYREALKLDPNHVVSLCSLAWLLRTQKRDFLGSRGLLQRAAEIDPHHPYLVMQREVY